MKKIFCIILCVATMLFSRTLKEIQDLGEIRIGVRLNFPPFSQEYQGEYNGFEVLLAKEIGRRIVGDKGKIVLLGVNAKDRIPMLQNNEADIMIANFSVTPEREKLVDVSLPYLLTMLGFLAPADSGLSKVVDFYNKRLLVIPGTTSEEYIKKNKNIFEPITIVNCKNTYDCFQKLKNNEADGYFHTVFSLANLEVIDNKYTVTNKHVSKPDYIAVAVQKGNKELVDIINKKIIELSKENFFKKAYDETFKIHYKGTIDRKYFLVDDVYSAFG
ncbi:amino acid ABC transporter, periplasmic cysteine-binding protein [Campylobacter blaseri]|uniref:Solute-binding protein family 3/N-terminal domain-containing protein n=1 Tax=Campylobacter blaseri TaxID=2042961 RepID=A0A2P8R2A2_9BACT|nr:transporter substrate-binding domain-containing protein [Campylobacter blaseri]PSM52635.1 hypothetical protein CQ405_02580 [Campylobacter blaseri]PSM54283.1 hypothetical protein CRN67_02580 [Campylobacter blaseri]QKF85934.1 amino acid ABC transporter, periplasmic cysteine-binding protein [Campylobacter blaseri]